jgi:hypothetical protein
LGRPQRVIVVDHGGVPDRRRGGDRRGGGAGPRGRGHARKAQQDPAAAVVPGGVEAGGLERPLCEGQREGAERRRVGGLDDHGRAAGGQRVQPDGHLRDQAERPVRADEEFAEVVPGDVLDDRAAAAGDRAVAEHHGDADDEVADPAVAVPGRSRVGGGDEAADGAAGVGRVDGEPLALGGQRPLGGRERHAGLEDGGEVAGVMGDDLVEGRRPDGHRALRVGAAPAGAAAGAGRADRAPVGDQLADQLGRVLDGRGSHQNRSASPAASSGCCR